METTHSLSLSLSFSLTILSCRTSKQTNKDNGRNVMREKKNSVRKSSKIHRTSSRKLKWFDINYSAVWMIDVHVDPITETTNSQTKASFSYPRFLISSYSSYFQTSRCNDAVHWAQLISLAQTQLIANFSMQNALVYWSEGQGFKPQNCQAATFEVLSKALNPLCSRGVVSWLILCSDPDLQG